MINALIHTYRDIILTFVHHSQLPRESNLGLIFEPM